MKRHLNYAVVVGGDRIVHVGRSLCGRFLPSQALTRNFDDATCRRCISSAINSRFYQTAAKAAKAEE